MSIQLQSFLNSALDGMRVMLQATAALAPVSNKYETGWDREPIVTLQKGEKCLPPPGIERRFVGRPDRILGTIPIILTWLEERNKHGK